tara:strand:- start:648 stop:1286 length:639 start_codon:yes stop_codon:yes gene_type:complete
MVNFKNEEILTYLLLVIGVYYIAKMYNQTCNGFTVGGINKQDLNRGCTTTMLDNTDAYFCSTENNTPFAVHARHLKDDGSNDCLGIKHPYKCQNLTEEEWTEFCDETGCYSSHPENPGFVQCLPNDHGLRSGFLGAEGVGAGPQCLESQQSDFNCFSSEITDDKCQNITDQRKHGYHSIHNDTLNRYCVLNNDSRAVDYEGNKYRPSYIECG